MKNFLIFGAFVFLATSASALDKSCEALELHNR